MCILAQQETPEQVRDDKLVGEAHINELNDFKKKAAFTLAEVLITLAIIGVVAAMTIPTLIQNYQERSWNTASTVFQRKLGEALTVMNTQGSLAGYQDTEDFVAELSKHMKISKICKNDDLMSCFEDKVIWGAENEEVDMTKVKNVSHFGQDEWEETDIVGAMFADGTNALIAYNKDCKQDPYSNRVITISENGIGTNCLAILYDTTGFKTPNTQQKDLRGLNIASLGGSNCAFEINGICYRALFTTTPLTKAECEELKGDLGISACNHDNDFWAGAVKACGGVNKMPTQAQLKDIADYVYNTTVSSSGTTSGLTLDYDKVAELGFTASPDYFYVWSGEEYGGNGAYYRSFGPTRTYWSYYGRIYITPQAVCLGD